LVKIRLQRHGRKKAPYYHIVVADSRKKRDGRIIEDLGRYNPVLETAQIQVNTERAMHWLKTGAQPTDTVERLLRKEGIYFRLHLERWKKTPEEIEQTVSAWKAERDAAKKAPLTSIEQKKAALKAEEEAFKAEQEKAAAAAAKKAEEAKAAKAKAEAEAKAAAEASVEETPVAEAPVEEASAEVDAETPAEEEKKD
jgi:small subunit ribosomal protein S16